MIIRRLLLVIFLVTFLSQSGLAAERRTPVVDAVAKARAAVVNIRTEKLVQRRNSPFFGFGDSIFDQFFQDMLPPRSYKTQSLGSGVIIDAAGHILTNAHVVDKASKIFIALSDNQPELEAELIGKDNRLDLAILKIIEAGNYPFLAPARSDDLMLGETIIAIGNPLGLGHSITTGIISSLQRRIQISQQQTSVFIQSDALINPGNSGGPLININGELVGINTAIAKQAQGIGFAIPIDTAKRVLGDLINYGRVRPGFMGILVGTVSSSFVKSQGEGGVLIEEVQSGSPARKAGLLEADVILKVDGISISFPEQYFSLLQTYTPGDSFDITLLRGAQQLTKRVELEPLPVGYELSYTRQVFGFELHQRRTGIYIDKVIAGAAADKAGFQRGDQVVKVDNTRVETLTEYKQAIAYRLGRRPLTFTVVRDNVGYLVELP
ncbi:trypsin-like peptidase domain-containing protein [uncultured Desulfuromusa sp.]|uniref:trypsin-like peptidase domain-containing protein n=1 Tax=uncultured Desulfuromusa sp. TaxID=219183 RepID=UPI002AA84DF7|nr:trypsin-like peptidase domain-containing protein [uncultured Desulfuromusa sp.]